MTYEFIWLEKEHYERAAQHGVNKTMLYNRYMKLQWPLERAITTPPRADRGNRIDKSKIAEAVARGYNENTYKDRIRAGWTHEQAITIPVGQRRPETVGKYRTKRVPDEAAARAATIGVSEQAVRYRLSQGWSLEKAVTTPPIPRDKRKYWRKYHDVN